MVPVVMPRLGAGDVDHDNNDPLYLQTMVLKTKLSLV